MSSLTETLAAGPAPKARGCILIRNIADHTDFDAILAAVNGDQWGHKELAELLSSPEHGLNVTPDRIRKHRGGECGCSR